MQSRSVGSGIGRTEAQRLTLRMCRLCATVAQSMRGSSDSGVLKLSHREKYADGKRA